MVLFELLDAFKPYILYKGYIGVHGCSLTIAQVKEDRFCVYLIPETLHVTTYQNVKVGDGINLEIDSHTQAVVDTVERLLKQKHLA